MTSEHAGIYCGSDCAQDCDEGTVVNLAASPAAGGKEPVNKRHARRV